jgi:TP901 family phage tail tape measure protein
VAVESSVRLRVDGSGAAQELNRVNKAAQALQGTIGKVTAALAGFGIVGGALKGLQEAEDAAAAVRTLGVNSEVLKKRLSEVSQELKGQVSETNLLKASYDVASAGFNSAAGASEILKASAQGAKGGLSDLNTVANATTSVLNAYGLSSDKASKLVDGFIQTQNDGKIIVAQYAAQIGRVAPTAAAAGVGIDELNAAIAAVTATGVPVESTFAGIRQVIASVIKPTSEASKRAKELGIEFNTAAIKQKGFAGFLEQVIEKTGGSEAEISKLFGSVEALTAIMPLVNDRLSKFNTALENQENSAGAAADAAKEMGNTVSGQVERIINNISNLARSFDEVFGPGLKQSLEDINRGLGALIGFVRNLDTNTVKAAANMLGFALKIKLAQAAFVLLRKAAIVQFLAKAIPMMTTANGKMVLLRFSTIKLKAAFIGLKAALPFGAILIGIDLVIGKMLEQNRLQSEFNDLVETGGKKALEAKQAELAAQKAGIEAKLAGLGPSRNDRGRAKALQRELTGVDAAMVQISGRLQTIELETAAAAEEERKRLAALKAQFEELFNQSTTEGDTGGNEAERLVQAAQDRLQAAKDENAVLRETEEGTRKVVKLDQRIRDIKAQESVIGKDLVEQLVNEELVNFRLLAQDRQRLSEAEKLRQQQEEQARQAQRIADEFQKGVVDAIMSAVDGSKKLSESLSGILKQVGRLLLTGLFKKAGIPLLGFANGGRPPVGRPSVVGERGPELFVPDSAGTIIPNGGFGGGANVVVNVDASGTSVQGDEGQSRQLGALIGAAVQGEIIKQQRPGGLLSR